MQMALSAMLNVYQWWVRQYQSISARVSGRNSTVLVLTGVRAKSKP